MILMAAQDIAQGLMHNTEAAGSVSVTVWPHAVTI